MHVSSPDFSSATLQLACALLARPSITPDDAGCMDVIRQRIEPLGFACEDMSSGPPQARVRNLWAKRKAPVEKAVGTLVFAGHTDVVPPDPANLWTSAPFAPQVCDGRLYARGANDMNS